MLARSDYPQEYIDRCRESMRRRIKSYRKLVIAADKAGAGDKALNSAVDAFEPIFFNDLVLVLDGYFVHRTRAVEKKDGNPMNEVRMISDSITNNNGVLRADNTIAYDPDGSVLKHQIGDQIRVDEAGFERLLEAFLADLEAKFVPAA